MEERWSMQITGAPQAMRIISMLGNRSSRKRGTVYRFPALCRA
jgi:hypothetical protein